MIQNSIERIAVFLDRDGTVIKNIPYLSDLTKIDFFDRSIESIKILNQIGVKVFIATNQSGVARGLITEEIVNLIHQKMQDKLKLENAKIDDFFYCPHLVDGIIEKYAIDCECRKPNSGMLLKAKNIYNIDLENSFIVGDSINDMKAGKNLGLTTFFINDKNENIENNLVDKKVSDLFEAVEFISSKIKIDNAN